MQKRKVLFIINPKSGSDKTTDRLSLINSLISDEYESEVLLWKELSDRDRLFARATSGNFDVAVAVGGDGTVSQLAEALCGTGTALGIIPFGSGNGLARHLGVPLKSEEAMRLIVNGRIVSIDRGRFGDKNFFCTAGVGFDAHIGKLFAESKTRGFWTYAKMTMRELRNYKPEKYTITIDGRKMEKTAFLVAIGNAGQYGNNAWIAPKAKINDGILELTILKPFRWWNAAGIGRKMFAKKLDSSRFAETYSGKEITIERQYPGAAHFDGEPCSMGTRIPATTEPGMLKVLVPSSFTG